MNKRLPSDFAALHGQHPRGRASVATRIKQVIIRHDLRPGDPLPTEAELCAELQVSRSSIREAVRTLDAFDIVEVRHGHGTYVGRLSMRALVESLTFRGLLRDPQDRLVILDLVEIRQMLEVGMAAQIVEAMQKEGLARELGTRIDAMEAMASREGDLLEEDRAFHLALMAPLGNELARQLTEAFWDVHALAVPEMRAGEAHDDARRATVDAHRAILVAAVEGDVGRLSAAIAQHYDPIRSRIRALLDA